MFKCDEIDDIQAMGRILIGLCQVGAWVCFDEFNKLKEEMLSAVSQQIQTIQESLKEMTKPSKKKSANQIELVGKKVTVNPEMAIFITMRSSNAGRSYLPDNLKNLFRSLAMTQPDNVLIAQRMLCSQGFEMAEKLAHKIVPFFKLCNEQISAQSSYEFGLRSLKSFLVTAGNAKRERKCTRSSIKLNEDEIIVHLVKKSVVPQLDDCDVPMIESILRNTFPGVRFK